MQIGTLREASLTVWQHRKAGKRYQVEDRSDAELKQARRKRAIAA